MTDTTTTTRAEDQPGRQAIDTAAKRLRDEAEITLANVGESRLAHDIMTVLDALAAAIRERDADRQAMLLACGSLSGAVSMGVYGATLARDVLSDRLWPDPAATPPVPSGEGGAT